MLRCPGVRAQPLVRLSKRREPGARSCHLLSGCPRFGRIQRLKPSHAALHTCPSYQLLPQSRCSSKPPRRDPTSYAIDQPHVCNHPTPFSTRVRVFRWGAPSATAPTASWWARPRGTAICTCASTTRPATFGANSRWDERWGASWSVSTVHQRVPYSDSAQHAAAAGQQTGLRSTAATKVSVGL